MSDEWASRSYTGGSAEPVAWDELQAVFDANFGEDTRSLARYPATMHHVHASWTESDGNGHEASSLDEVRQAYADHLTYEVTFSGFREGGWTLFGSPPGGLRSKQEKPDTVSIRSLTDFMEVSLRFGAAVG